jgi:hypothetical protein
MMLDSGYFALNQRSEVAMERANDFTLSDLLRNEPGLPVRSKSGDAVRPIGAGQLSFPVMEALEYVSVMAESRTGIVRNAQGLNPDTLHDTATGAQALMSAAAKRVRMIARLFAETGLKDLFLGVHALLRKHQVDPVWAQLNGQWVQLNPSAWAERAAMTIELGLGSSGRAQDLALSQLLLGLQKEIIQLQQGVGGPFVTAQNLSNALTMAVRKAGFRAPELYFSNPAQAPPQPPKPAPPGDPAKMAEVQARAQADQSRLQLDTHRQRSADVADALRLRAEAEDRAFVRQAHDDKMRLEHRRLDLEASKLALKTDTERHGQGAKAATAVTTRAMQDHAVVAKAHLGAAADLAVQAARSQDARLLAEHERALDAARDARAPSAGGEGEAP